MRRSIRPFDALTTSVRERELLAALKHRRMGAGRGDVAPPFPLKIQIQTTTRCNAACAMCPYPVVTHEPGFAHGEMELALYEAILAQLAGRGVERLSLFLMNEPLLDVRLPDWIARARAALPATRLCLFSNGAALRPAKAEALAAAGLDELVISVHGFEKETYERVMAGLSFDRTVGQLRDVFRLAAGGGLGAMRLELVMGDLPELTRTLDQADPLLRDHVLLKAFSNERAASGSGEGMASSAIAAAAAPPLCQRPFVKLYVLASGDCVLCNVDWRRTILLGRLDAEGRTTIDEVWNGPRYGEIRRQHLAADFEKGLLCRDCDYASVVGDE